MSVDADALIALAERVEQATGPDRALDAEIANLLMLPLDWGMLAAYYTDSLDSAMSVFPAGWMYRSGNDGAGPDPSDFFCEAIGPAPDCARVRAVAATEPNARLTAALRARASQTPETNDE